MFSSLAASTMLDADSRSVLDDLARRQASGSTHHAAARMAHGAARCLYDLDGGRGADVPALPMVRRGQAAAHRLVVELPLSAQGAVPDLAGSPRCDQSWYDPSYIRAS